MHTIIIVLNLGLSRLSEQYSLTIRTVTSQFFLTKIVENMTVTL